MRTHYSTLESSSPAYSKDWFKKLNNEQLRTQMNYLIDHFRYSAQHRPIMQRLQQEMKVRKARLLILSQEIPDWLNQEIPNV